MYARTTRNLILFGISLMILSVSCQACDWDRMNDVITNFRIGSMVKSLDTSIHFYGRVVDQNGDPVVGARVSVGIRRFSLIGPFFMGSKNLKVVTDQKGFFKVFQLRGSRLFIGEITRDGYEFDWRENRNNEFTYKGSPGEPVFVPDKNDPVVFRMRKKLKNRTFLFENRDWGITISVKESGILKGSDFIEGKKSQMPGEKLRASRSRNCDLFYRATYDGESGKWHVVLKPSGPGGGILASDQMLYVAPVQGYEDELSFVPEDGVVPKERYIYIRSRLPTVYSRIEIEYVIAFEGFFKLSGKRATNPYGDRVLDSVDWPPYSRRPEIERILQLRDLLEAEARTMLGDGRLPQRPKIMALIEAVKRGDKTLEALERETREWKTVKNPNYLYQYWKRGVDKFERRIFKGAVEEFDEYLRRGGGSDGDSVYSYKGEALEELGDFEGALECYRSALEKFPEEIDTYIRFVRKVIRVREKMGDIEGAIADLKELSRRQHDVQARRLEEIERELALLEERPDQRRYRKLHSEKVKLKDNLEHWVREYGKKQKQLEEKLKAQQVAP